MNTVRHEPAGTSVPAVASEMAPKRRDAALAALLEASRSYFALPAEALHATRASAAAVRCR
jgi:hypothetical protein